MQESRGTAFVTGAAGGMGRAISRALVDSGRRVVLADRDEQGVRDLAAELGPASHALALDICDAAAVDSCLERVPPDFATIDVLINNAGHDIGGRKRFDIGSADDWSAIIETNLIGTMRVTRAILPGMVARNRGDVVTMGSISALRYVPDMAPYSASKAGVHMLSDIIRGELAETAIRVTEIMPGLTRTGIIAARYRGDQEETRRYFDQFRMALDPEDVARCILFAIDQPPHVQMAQMVVLPVNRW
ncbi:SDR family oxidoreductase [Arenibaculum pallidiluteum]|uniref:SDR family oxidoreductase n=1 Tax=Arenibaculum pallidiluteum TaxID=2812559 RepID=UPI001A96F7DD|nr:SDR family oxidoreductase [Arenibaculum pallidiluteum]